MEFFSDALEPIDFTHPYILGIGRLIWKKGFDILIDSFALLKKEFSQAHLLLVGDGTERKKLEERVSKLNLQDSVTFTGQVHPNQVPELINKANIVVIPSRTPDPLPTVALEAGFLSRPVVAANMGGLKEIIVDGKTGFLIDSEDPQKYLDAILYLYNHPQQAMQIGQNARARINKTFNWDQYITNYDNLYQQLVNEDLQHNE